MERWGLLSLWDSAVAVPSVTYQFSPTGPSSTIDHFLCSAGLFQSAKYVTVMSGPLTPSRHNVIKSEFDIHCDEQITKPGTFQPKVAWYKATKEQEEAYSAYLSDLLSDITVPTCVFDCPDLQCQSDYHKMEINKYCEEIINCCLNAENETIPKTKPPKRQATAGWTVEVEPLREISLQWHHAWVEQGKPPDGVLADTMRETRRDYHKSVKNCLKQQKLLKKRRFGELSLQKNSKTLFQELKKLGGASASQVCAPRIDGSSVDAGIADCFANKYRNLYNADNSSMESVQKSIESRMYCADKGCCNVTTNEVGSAIRNLKTDKHDGDNFYSNHIIRGGFELQRHLGLLFSAMLIHGHSPPSALLKAKIISIPKDLKGDLCSSDNYRGIALGSAIGKTFDSIVLKRYGGSHLATSSMQFAYKPMHSTAMCTTTMKEIIRCYWNKNTDVYECGLNNQQLKDILIVISTQ